MRKTSIEMNIRSSPLTLITLLDLSSCFLSHTSGSKGIRMPNIYSLTES